MTPHLANEHLLAHVHSPVRKALREDVAALDNDENLKCPPQVY